jgi:transcriptional regulator with XRE-family HTH domain
MAASGWLPDAAAMPGRPNSTDYLRRYARFTRRLRQARERAGLSQAEAARRLGKGDKGYSFVWKSEDGSRRVDVVEAELFARLYGVPITFFYE